MWAQTILLPVTAIALLLISIVLFWRSQRRIRLQCLIFPSWSPISVHREVKEKVRVYYDDTLVTDLFLTQVRIRNSGNVPISKKDIVEPLTFKFKEGTKILNWDVVETKPEGLKLDLEHVENESNLRCSWELMNENEEATLTIECCGKESHRPNVYVRIIGCTLDLSPSGMEVELRESKPSLTVISLLMIIGGLIGFLLFGYVFIIGLTLSTAFSLSGLAVLGLAAGSLFMLVMGIREWRLRRFL